MNRRTGPVVDEQCLPADWCPSPATRRDRHPGREPAGTRNHGGPMAGLQTRATRPTTGPGLGCSQRRPPALCACRAARRSMLASTAGGRRRISDSIAPAAGLRSPGMSLATKEAREAGRSTREARDPVVLGISRLPFLPAAEHPARGEASGTPSGVTHQSLPVVKRTRSAVGSRWPRGGPIFQPGIAPDRRQGDPGGLPCGEGATEPSPGSKCFYEAHDYLDCDGSRSLKPGGNFSTTSRSQQSSRLVPPRAAEVAR